MKRTRLMLLFGSPKAHATVSIQLAQYAAQLLLQPTCLIVCVPSAFRLLATELSSGFDRAVLREAEAAEDCHSGCHYIFTCCQKHCTNAPREIAPTGKYTLL